MPQKAHIGMTLPHATRNLIIILGDQLNLDNAALEGFDPQQDHVLMAEVQEEASHVWSHQARIALFFSAMRHFAEALKDLAFPCTYLRIGTHAHQTLDAVWLAHIRQHAPQKIIVCEPGDYRVLGLLQQTAQGSHLPLVV